MSGVDCGPGDGYIGCLVRGVTNNERKDNSEKHERDKDGREEIAAGGLGEGQIGHWLQSSKSRLYREDVSDLKDSLFIAE